MDESYTKKSEKKNACSYGYKSVCVDDKFSKSFKLKLSENAVTISLILCSERVNIAVL